jgi:hypothetical protein
MIYRWALHLYPYEFRRKYADELEADFEAQRSEAIATGGRRALLWCYANAAFDLLRSVPREWLRTPWTAVVVLAAGVACAVFYYVVGRVYRVRAFGSGAPSEQPQLLLLMAAMVLIPIAGMLLIGLALRVGSTRLPQRRRRV